MAAQAPSEPRFRPFRLGAWVVYLLVAGAFSVMITVSVVRSVLAMTPEHRAAASAAVPVDECLGKARALFSELETQRAALARAQPASKANLTWLAFRLQWLDRHRDVESSCAVTQPGREQLRAVFKRLESVMDLYTTHSVQFSGEVGPTIDAFEEALSAAKH